MDVNLGKLQEMVRDRKAWCATVHGLQRVRHNLVTEQHFSEEVGSDWSRSMAQLERGRTSHK